MNTDKELMLSEFDDEVAVGIINTYNLANPNGPAITDDTNVSILGIPELTFSLREMGFTTADGKTAQRVAHVNVASWMINHGILKTDLGERVFEAPFVYANGVANQQSAKPEVTVDRQVVTPNETPVETAPTTEANPEPKSPVKKYPGATPENLAKYGLTEADVPNRKPMYGAWVIVPDRNNPGKYKVTSARPDMVEGAYSTVRGESQMNSQ
jgi:hypothetical protein